MRADRQPAWTERPPATLGTVNFQIIRSSREFALRLVVVALGDILGATVHWSGRTVPCLLPHYKCPWCLRGIRKRWVGYFPAYWPKETRRACCEVTPTAVASFDEYRKNHGTIRGAEVQLWRAKDKHNGILLASLHPAKLPAGTTLPEAFDVKECITRTWNYERHVIEAQPAEQPEAPSYLETLERIEAAERAKRGEPPQPGPGDSPADQAPLISFAAAAEQLAAATALPGPNGHARNGRGRRKGGAS